MALDTSHLAAQSSNQDASHIFSVAVRSLQDSVDLLVTIKEAIAEEENDCHAHPKANGLDHTQEHGPDPSTSVNKGSDTRNEWCVDYDQRSREVPMETNMDFAITELKRLQEVLETIQRMHQEQSQPHASDQGMSISKPLASALPVDLHHPLTLQATIDPKCDPVPFQTTFGRELWFCSLHAVHHFAMIKVICSEHGVALKEGFGLAPSTVKSRISQ
ncbi:hypothetical protein BGW38_002292 [Lunasporangiospora selenospora]|uniref:DinB superfamily protein n=1 Tax=Lunasporangiospora selenospora TaxID=979761 RepID=A0A9P6KDI9_9FUNG|nr:hypothetical protein BGW38_002292 [Lunasporangiospora selenospora]